jgi:hypothetical protein
VTIALTSDRDPLVAWLAREQDDCFSCSHLMIAGLRSHTPVTTVSNPRERAKRYALGVDARREANPGMDVPLAMAATASFPLASLPRSGP